MAYTPARKGHWPTFWTGPKTQTSSLETPRKSAPTSTGMSMLTAIWNTGSAKLISAPNMHSHEGIYMYKQNYVGYSDFYLVNNGYEDTLRDRPWVDLRQLFASEYSYAIG